MEKYECWEEYNKYGYRTRHADSRGLLVIDIYDEMEWKMREHYYFSSSTEKLVTYEQSKKIELYEFVDEQTDPKAISISKGPYS